MDDQGGSLDGLVQGALELVPFAMLVADGAGRVIGANRRWSEISGLDEIASLGRGWLDALSGDSRALLERDLDRVAARGGTACSDHQLSGGGSSRWTRWWLSRHLQAGEPLVAMAAADVDDDYARQASLYHLATHDALTGLANRSHFVDSIEQALRRNQRQARRVGVVYVDLDGFKHVNDRGGHSLGDRVLLAIGSRLRHAVRAADTVARIGGDEFAVLCEGLAEAEQAEVVARRIEQALAESVELDGERWTVPASVGAAVDRGGPDTAEELMDRADRAMYSAKHARQSPAGPESPADEQPGPATSDPGAADRPAGEPLVEGLRGSTGPAGPGGTPPAPGAPWIDAGPPADAAALRDSLTAIRGLLDRLLSDGHHAIDIRDAGLQERNH